LGEKIKGVKQNYKFSRKYNSKVITDDNSIILKKLTQPHKIMLGIFLLRGQVYNIVHFKLSRSRLSLKVWKLQWIDFIKLKER